MCCSVLGPGLRCCFVDMISLFPEWLVDFLGFHDKNIYFYTMILWI